MSTISGTTGEGLVFSFRGAGVLGDQSVQEITDTARLIEAAGFDQLWSGNDFLHSGGLVTIAALLMATETLKIGSGVIDCVSIHPGQIAQQASGFQYLSDDRFLLGIGAGSDAFFSQAGIAASKPAVRTREALIAVRLLSQGRSPAENPLAGDGWTERAVLRHPREVPIYVGAMGPRMLETAGRYADGVMALCLPPSHYFHVREHVERGRQKAGLTMDGFDLAAGVWCAISDDDEDARRQLASFIAHYAGSLSTDALLESGLDPDEFQNTQRLMDTGDVEAAIASVTPAMMTLGIVGGTTQVIDQCLALIDAGVRHISFGPPTGRDKHHAIRLIGQHVLPELRRHAA